MATLEERLAGVEVTVRTHDAMFNLSLSILERQISTLERQTALLEEVRRDAKQTRRLWVRLAQRYGWLDESDSEEEPNAR